CGRNSSDGPVSSGNAVHAPAHGRVRGVGHSGRKCHLVAEHDGIAQRRHAYGDGRWWWWWWGDCTSSAAAKGPRAHCEKSQEADSRPSKIFSDPLRKWPQALPRIILRMARPDAVRRVKSYSAADGFVYQYYFFEGNRGQRGGSVGGEFTYVVSIDRQSAFPFKIFVHQSALDGWAAQNGRSLSSSEEYAVAKMRLFRAFDESAVKASPQGEPPREVVVNEANLEELLGQ